MKKTMNDYRKAIDSITPSPSFISETEALMKKYRDEHSGTEKTAAPHDVRETDRIVLNDSDYFKRRRTVRSAAVLSTAAAVFIAVFAVGTASKRDISVDTPMDPPVFTEDSAVTAADIETSAAENVTEKDNGIEEEAPETVSETQVQTEPEIYDEEISEESTAIFNENEEVRETDARILDEPEKTENIREEAADREETPREPPKNTNAADTKNSVTQKERVPAEEFLADEEADDEEGLPEVAAYIGFDSVEENAEDDNTDSGVPMYVPGFGSETGVYGDNEEEVEEEIETDGRPVGSDTSVYSLVFGSAPDSSSDNAAAADRVYVPDSIFDMEPDEYYIIVNAGFDEYDNITKTFYAYPQRELNAESGGMENVMSAVKAASESGSVSYYDSERHVSDYRYIISVYSSDESENNAMIFEIMFNRNTLIINRYDNGTVSSAEYTISEEYYEKSDEVIYAVID